MKTVTAIFTANSRQDLEMFAVCGIKYESTKTINSKTMIIEWICEEPNNAVESVMDDISMRELDMWNVTLKSIA
jgi:hypothetical protein